MTIKTATEHLQALLVNDGHAFAMVRKADLQSAVDALLCFRGGRGVFVNKLAELRRTMVDQSDVIDEAFSCIRSQGLNAAKHGDERRRYMGNNRALLAQAEQQSAAIAEMGELIDDQAAEIASLKESLARAQSGNRYLLGSLKHARSCLEIIRRATL